MWLFRAGADGLFIWKNIFRLRLSHFILYDLFCFSILLFQIAHSTTKLLMISSTICTRLYLNAVHHAVDVEFEEKCIMKRRFFLLFSTYFSLLMLRCSFYKFQVNCFFLLNFYSALLSSSHSEQKWRMWDAKGKT